MVALGPRTYDPGNRHQIKESMKVFHKTRAVFSLFFRAFGAYRWSIAGMAAFSVVSGVLEGVGITAIIPLFSVIVGGKASDSISRSIADFFAYLHLPFTAKFLLAFMIALFLAKTIFLFLSQQMTAQVNAHFERKIRSTLLRSTLMAKWPFLLSQKVGHLDQMLTTEVSSSSAILLYLSNGMLVVVNFFIYSILVFNISPVIATLTVFSGLVIFFIFLPLLQKVRITSDKMVRENKELAHYASEHIIGAKTLKSMRLEEPALNRGFALSEIMRKLYLRLFFLKNSTAALLQLAGIFFVIGLFVFFIGCISSFAQEANARLERSLLMSEQQGTDKDSHRHEDPQEALKPLARPAIFLSRIALSLLPDFDHFNFSKYLLKDLALTARSTADGLIHALPFIGAFMILGILVMLSKDFS